MSVRYQPLPSRQLSKLIAQLGAALGWDEVRQKSHVWNDERGSILDYTSVFFWWESKSYGGRQLIVFPHETDNLGLTRREIQHVTRPFTKLEAVVLSSRHRLYAGPVVFTVPRPPSLQQLVTKLKPLLLFDNFKSKESRDAFFNRFPGCRVPKLRNGEHYFPTRFRLIRGDLVAEPQSRQAIAQAEKFGKREM